jgi:hypothetical protein
LADEPHDSSQFLSDGVALLRRYNDAGMLALQMNPALMQNAVIGGIVCEQGSVQGRRNCQTMSSMA